MYGEGYSEQDLQSERTRDGQFCQRVCDRKAWLMLPQHRLFVAFEVDAKCYKSSWKRLVEMYARQVLNDETDITASVHVSDACKAVVRVLEALRARRQMEVW